MKIKSVVLVLLASVGSIFAEFSTASETFGCEVALVETNVSYEYDSTLRLSLLNLIDRKSFNQKRSGGSGGFKIPIKGVPVKAFANYNKFSEARQSEYKENRFKLSKEESQAYVASYVPEAGFRAFTECLRTSAQSRPGLHLIQKELSNDYVSLDVYWNPPAGVGDRGVKTFNLSGAELAGQTEQPEELKVNHYYALDFDREASKPFRFTIAVDGYAAKRLSIPLASAPTNAEIKQPWEIPGYRPPLNVLVHQQSFEDLKGSEGNWVGIPGRSKHLEGIQISFKVPIRCLQLEYMCHLQGANFGDSNWKPAGTFCGTRGEKRRLEGFAMRLSGQLAPSFQVVYGCHIQSTGDVKGVLGPNYCGTRGQKKRAEAMYVYIERVRP